MSIEFAALTDFLIKSKKQTYASHGDEAVVRSFLNGSKQLEIRSGDYLYRDIYFGFSFFAGQEMIEYQDRPIWSMVYSGGITVPNASRETTVHLYSFLRDALRAVDGESPYRGPQSFQANAYLYQNEVSGTFERFTGYESIQANDVKMYELTYSGGMIL
ncbi:DUF5680 domain-containing protein [Paenibacillus sp. HWE-109]|uniref:DUF5680 domain-containing protein n=1 Tax=Paenibacillus sp. HWE-109 TaxID=1306526 RepID=UPI001EDE8716|nr:DUF5680 domain-containing protein [Paenibacillus sp. HWE-109]UKS29962.1 DUF5680 domain-containing protein [Paenibacillus sp. HWE-109]